MRAPTAGLLISYTVGRRHNVCCRGPILITRPDSETSAQTTHVSMLFKNSENLVQKFPFFLNFTLVKKTLTKNAKQSRLRFYQKRTMCIQPCGSGWGFQNWSRIWNRTSTAKVMMEVPTSDWQEGVLGTGSQNRCFRSRTLNSAIQG